MIITRCGFRSGILRRCFISLRLKSSKAPPALTYDVVVVGGGHAGCESAAAAARCGSRTLLITNKKEKIGEMSCNPSFGGIGKGHLMREVDALDGLCARLCDQTAITFQALNRSKGPAVLGLRAQIDRNLYKNAMQEEILERTPNLCVIEASVEDLLLAQRSDLAEGVCSSQHSVIGCVLHDGSIVHSKSVVITTGTFLNGKLFCGRVISAGGRMGEDASYGLAATFSRLGFRCGRMRTGTPPRIIAESIDFDKFQRMDPDQEPIPFSFITDEIRFKPHEQLPTYIGYTNDRMAELVLTNPNEYFQISERDDANGPRYCPSLPGKVIRFPHLRHRLFLEHEGFDSNLIYPQGCGISCGADEQLKIFRAIDGLEKVEFARPGYAVYYDFINPQQLNRTLETRLVSGLFLAGQINGSTGYEEAAGQGILAGINAAQKAKGSEEMLELDRSQAYIGVLIDDLASLGTNEPYRMFTSRVEFRLHLRPDNADRRLTELGRRFGAVGGYRYQRFCAKRDKFDECKRCLDAVEFSLPKWRQIVHSLAVMNDKPSVHSAYDLLMRYPHLTFKDLQHVVPKMKEFIDDKELQDQIRVEARYTKQHDYMMKNFNEVKREADALLPETLNYLAVEELSLENREKLDQLRPRNIAAASRISGITPDALIHLLRYARLAQNRLPGPEKLTTISN